METYKVTSLMKKMIESKLSLVNSRTLKLLLGIQNEQTFFRIVEGLKKENVIKKIERDKYQIVMKPTNDFEMANFLYEPSYISLETALNYWGILSQFPFEITSVTSKKSVSKKLEDRVFSYSHLAVHIYGMYRKLDGFLIAIPEKALYDQLYLASKGLRTVSPDEYDVSKIKKREFLNICDVLKANSKMYQFIGGLQWSH